MFTTGKTVMTSGIAHESQNDPEFAKSIREAYGRYLKCDWGDTSESDKGLNDEAVKNGDDRILASYNVRTGEGTKKVFIVTEWDRSVTTILFPEEY